MYIYVFFFKFNWCLSSFAHRADSLVRLICFDVWLEYNAVNKCAQVAGITDLFFDLDSAECLEQTGEVVKTHASIHKAGWRWHGWFM